jgi:hypothetical protein
MKRECTCIGLLLVVLTAALAGCEGQDGRGDANVSASGSGPRAAAQRETPVERIIRERAWLADKALEEMRELVDETNQKLAKINGKTFIHEQELKRVAIFVPEPELQPELQREGMVRVPPPLYAPDCVLNSQPEKVPENAVVKQWADRVAEAQSIEARFELGEVVEVNRTDSLDAPFEAVVSGKALWTHRRGLAQEIHSIPETPEGKMEWLPDSVPGRVRFFGYGRGSRKLKLPLPELAGKIRAPNSDLQRKAIEALKQAQPESGAVPIRLRVVFGIKSDEVGLRVLTEDDGEWGPGMVWPDCGAVPWKTGLPEGGGTVLKPEQVRLPEDSSGS